MAKEQTQKRRKCSDEYKAETVRLIHSSGKSGMSPRFPSRFRSG
jgi:hypothetical protein